MEKVRAIVRRRVREILGKQRESERKVWRKRKEGRERMAERSGISRGEIKKEKGKISERESAIYIEKERDIYRATEREGE